MSDVQPPDPGARAAGLTHLDAHGRARMVDVSPKPPTARRAVAEALLHLDPGVREELLQGRLPKGEALAVARVAGILAAKDTARLVPLCHPLPLGHVAIDFAPVGETLVRITSEASTVAPTGVEMEAMVAASVAALVLYDMVKGRCREASIREVRLLAKSGGRSGDWRRADAGGTA
ncbi:MAG: cyclic pyranopterin monophosphate synthase MoaC [Planctomycetes bacterium]|nr:cyclic pyranopterin monophosphate synthase MoaC [Planctomycetota bacterium]